MSDYPYAGLRPFKREETNIFFGREEHIDELLNYLSRQHFLAVTGVSGCGKSSLVKTGLIPSLQAGFLGQAGTHWRIAEMRPGNQPFANLAQELVKKDALGEDYRTALFQNEILKRGLFSLHELLAIKPLPNRAKLLIVCDQFEEIFRYHQQIVNSEAAAFVALLLASTKPYPLPTGELFNDIYVIITMRSDFFGECSLFTGLAEAINSGLYLTPRLNREQLRLAIEEPALVCGGKVDPELVVKLLEDASNNQDELPLLQHVLMRLWYLAPDKSIALNLIDYEAIGGLTDALSNHADEVYDQLEDEKQKDIAELLFRNLTENDPGKRDTRRPIKLQEIIDLTNNTKEEIEAIEAVINSFRKEGRCFLTLNPEPKSDDLIRPDTLDTVIDISHESLIRQWQKLKDWTKDEAESAAIYRGLEESALEFEEHKFDEDYKDYFYQKSKLKIAKAWSDYKNPTPKWAIRYGKHFVLAMDFLRDSYQEDYQQWLKQRKDEETGRELKNQLQEKKVVEIVLKSQLEEKEEVEVELKTQLEEQKLNIEENELKRKLAEQRLEQAKKQIAQQENQIIQIKQSRLIAIVVGIITIVIVITIFLAAKVRL